MVHRGCATQATTEAQEPREVMQCRISSSSSIPATHPGCCIGARRRAHVPANAQARAIGTSDTPHWHQPSNRVVVTGMGVASPLGWSPGELHSRLMAGESGVQTLTNPEFESLPVRIASPVDGQLEPSRWLPSKLAKRADRYIALMAASAKSALADAGIVPSVEHCSNPDVADPARSGIVAGSAMGGMSALCGGVNALFTASYRRMSPFCIPFAISNTGAALSAIDIGFEGPNYSATSACATGNHCISLASSHIARGEADVILAGASDAALLPAGIAGFAAARSLSTRNDAPSEASRPFDCTRDGFVMGEGSAMLALESLEHARARSAQPIAEIAGFSSNNDAFHMTEPDPSGTGMARCIKQAMQSAGVTPGEIDHINAHATSTKAGDAAELKAIAEALRLRGGEESSNSTAAAASVQRDSTVVAPRARPWINSTKSMVGHLLGASGALEAVATIKAIERGEVHPTMNFACADANVDASGVVGVQPEHGRVRVALSNSFGFGGHNSVLVLREPPERQGA